MNFLKNLFRGSGASDASDQNVLWLYVQCAKCGAPLAIRIDTRNEISTDYETGRRFLRKEMMDSTCFQLMHAQVYLDDRGNVVEQSIERGKFLTRAEFDALKAEWDERKRQG